MVHYKNFIQCGRIVLITRGEFRNKVAAIVEIIDQNYVLVDGPLSGVPRIRVNLKLLKLIPIVSKFFHGSKTDVVKNAWKRDKIDEKWKATGTYKAIQKKTIRQNLGDFERFQVMIAKMKKSAIIRSTAIKANSTKKDNAAKAPKSAKTLKPKAK